jgi:hypothetical protein
MFSQTRFDFPFQILQSCTITTAIITITTATTNRTFTNCPCRRYHRSDFSPSPLPTTFFLLLFVPWRGKYEPYRIIELFLYVRELYRKMFVVVPS